MVPNFMILTDIEVMKTASIAELRLAVEAAFSHMPKKGPGKISWYVHGIIIYEASNDWDLLFLLCLKYLLRKVNHLHFLFF